MVSDERPHINTSLGVITIIMLISIQIVGCLNNFNGEGETPISIPSIYMDKSDKLYIIWMEADEDWESGVSIDYSQKDYKRWLTVIDSEGSIQVEKQLIRNFPKSFHYHDFIVDSEGCYHFASREMENLSIWPPTMYISYTKLNSIGEILIPKMRLRCHEGNMLGYPQITINQKDQIFIVWHDPKSIDDPTYPDIFFVMIDNGSVQIPIQDISNDPNYADLYPLFFHSSDSYIYVLWEKERIGNYYLTLWQNGTIHKGPTSLDHDSEIEGHPIIMDENGKSFFLAENGVVDSSNNIHIFSSIINPPPGHDLVYTKLDENGSELIVDKAIYSKLGYTEKIKIRIDTKDCIHLVWKEENSIFYTKLDSNGKKIIDKMVIFRGNNHSSPSFLNFGISAMMIVTIAIVSYFKKSRS